MSEQDNEHLPAGYAEGLAAEHAARLKASAASRGEPEPDIDVEKLAYRLRRGVVGTTQEQQEA